MTLSNEGEQLFNRAQKHLLAPLEKGRPPRMDRATIEQHLPHRDPFLLLDEILHLDDDAGLIIARYDLRRAAPVLAGHFPGRPLWPGVLHIEAVAQAGVLLALHALQRQGDNAVTLTHVLGARFLRPVGPDGSVFVLAHAFEDGLFLTVIGQCVWNGQICSAAALSGL